MLNEKYFIISDELTMRARRAINSGPFVTNAMLIETIPHKIIANDR
jgi:hypothetical protein